MTQQPQPSTSNEQEATGFWRSAGVAASSLAEAWLRDTLLTGCALLSLAVALSGFAAADGAWWAVLGCVVGLPCAVAPFVGVVRRWPITRIWLTMLVVVVLDVAALTAIVTSG